MRLVKKVDKLVALSVLSSVALAWGFIVGLDALITFLKEMNDVGTGQYTASKAVIYELLTLPRRAYEWFAYGALIVAPAAPAPAEPQGRPRPGDYRAQVPSETHRPALPDSRRSGPRP